MAKKDQETVDRALRSRQVLRYIDQHLHGSIPQQVSINDPGMAYLHASAKSTSEAPNEPRWPDSWTPPAGQRSTFNAWASRNLKTWRRQWEQEFGRLPRTTAVTTTSTSGIRKKIISKQAHEESAKDNHPPSSSIASATKDDTCSVLDSFTGGSTSGSSDSVSSNVPVSTAIAQAMDARRAGLALPVTTASSKDVASGEVLDEASSAARAGPSTERAGTRVIKENATTATDNALTGLFQSAAISEPPAAVVESELPSILSIFSLPRPSFATSENRPRASQTGRQLTADLRSRVAPDTAQLQPQNHATILSPSSLGSLGALVAETGDHQIPGKSSSSIPPPPAPTSAAIPGPSERRQLYPGLQQRTAARTETAIVRDEIANAQLTKENVSAIETIEIRAWYRWWLETRNKMKAVRQEGDQ